MLKDCFAPDVYASQWWFKEGRGIKLGYPGNLTL